jgi:membrane protease subunit HflK
MREIVGQSDIEPILTGARAKTEADVQALMQKILDSYGAGVQVTQVQLQKVDPPAQVIDAFRDVQAARADQERLQNEAQAYANRIIPEAKGASSRQPKASATRSSLWPKATLPASSACTSNTRRLRT